METLPACKFCGERNIYSLAEQRAYTNLQRSYTFFFGRQQDAVIGGSRNIDGERMRVHFTGNQIGYEVPNCSDCMRLSMPIYC